MRRNLLLLLPILLFTLSIGYPVGAASIPGEIKEKQKGLLPESLQQEKDTLRILFIGNSFTQRNALSEVVKTMIEQGNPGLVFDCYTHTYGGRSLEEHWKLGSQHFITQSVLEPAEEKAMISRLEDELAKDTAFADPFTKFYAQALIRHKDLLQKIEDGKQIKWDMVVLQSWQDDRFGKDSPYLKYAARFAQLASAIGARVVLYETTPVTQNAYPLSAAPDKGPVLEKIKIITELAKSINADLVPMSLVAHRCQTQRPDLTMRYIDDFHPNQTMTFLTASTFYAVITGKTPLGLPLDRVRASSYLNEDNKDLDQNGDPIVRIFSEKDRNDLQRIAWEGYNEILDTRRSK